LCISLVINTFCLAVIFCKLKHLHRLMYCCPKECYLVFHLPNWIKTLQNDFIIIWPSISFLASIQLTFYTFCVTRHQSSNIQEFFFLWSSTIFCKQLHSPPTAHKIYYTFSEATCSSRGIMLSRLVKSGK
jgi:hypothetical protein